MRIVGALCWFWEPVAFLERMARSLAGVVDELVAMDGPWENFSHRALNSPARQVEALHAASDEAGLSLDYRPCEMLWESQVAKRSALYDYCSSRGDWMLVIDGDEYVVFHDRDGLRRTLAETDKLAAAPGMKRISERRPLERTPRRLFRTHLGLSVMEAHNGIVTDEGLWLAGPRRITKQPVLDVSDFLRMEHEHMARGETRNLWARRYYQIRARDRIEVH